MNHIPLSAEPRLHETADMSALSEVFRLRVEAWSKSGLHPPAFKDKSALFWTDEHDAHATHWIIESEGTILAAARLCQHDRISEAPDGGYYLDAGIMLDGPFAAMSRLVVKPSAQCRGFAKMLDTARLEKATHWKCPFVLVYTTNVRRTQPLLTFGFERAGLVKVQGDAPVHCFVKQRGKECA